MPVKTKPLPLPAVVPLPKASSEPQRLLSKPEVIELTGRSFPTIWNWMINNKFPRARDCNGRPVWIAAEVDDWINALPIRRLKGDGDATH
jgi:predicted DNA-binding transcriptional regulator AlpA